MICVICMTINNSVSFELNFVRCLAVGDQKNKARCAWILYKFGTN